MRTKKLMEIALDVVAKLDMTLPNPIVMTVSLVGKTIIIPTIRNNIVMNAENVMVLL